MQHRKIERKIKRELTLEDLANIENSIKENIDYIDGLDEDELESLDEYYDIRIKEYRKNQSGKD